MLCSIMADNGRLKEKALSNGDVYVGFFKGILPHGKGKYTWSDGTIFEGEWEDGKMMGRGKIIWPSGAKYEGDISGGYLHGFGTFSGADGSIDSGAWRMNIHHGIGRKQHSNSDIYEGSWKEGVREGSGQYYWMSGNTYSGNWKGGTMSGKGTIKYVNGDLFSGFWLNGYRHGYGIYKFADGGYYFGTWSRGLKDGKGTFYPAGTKPPSLGRWTSLLVSDIDGKCFLSHNSKHDLEQHEAPKPHIKRSLTEKNLTNGILESSRRISQKASVVVDRFLRDINCGVMCYKPSHMLTNASNEGQDEVQGENALVYVREYMQGVLMKERTKSYAEMMHKYKERNKSFKASRKRSGGISGGLHRSYYLMLNLQLGIRYTVGKITPVPMREVRSSDFGERARIRMYFPKKGSQFTPPHHSIDFHWKDYCPMVFRNLREMFKLDAAEYMMSTCGNDGLREHSSPGKSGSIFYLSHDDRFVIKTLKKSELKVLLKMLPSYYDHVRKHENTLITKFFGLHCIKLKGGRKVRFVVMGNMFCTELQIHRCYDLKGSTHGRYTDEDKIEEATTLKDLDLSYEFHMDKLLREALFKQISLDCLFLESQQIIDYSLLLGLNFRAPQHLKAFLDPLSTMHNREYLLAEDVSTSEEELVIPSNGLLLVTHEPSSVSTAPGPHIRGSTLKAYALGQKEVDLLLPGTARLRVQLGVNMPAQATHKLLHDSVDHTEVELFEVYDVVLYMGIIDILQEYNVRKKVEHAYKSLQFDPVSISVAEPHLYAKRFISFLERIFPDRDDE